MNIASGRAGRRDAGAHDDADVRLSDDCSGSVRPAVSEPRFTWNQAAIADVRDHLLACEAGFTPPLATRVVIDDYAAKLIAQAERCEAWAGPDLIGLVAVYCNAPDRLEAFVTSVSVVPGWTRRGLGRRLLEAAIARVRCLGFHRLALSVHRGAGALRLYEALGFAIAAETEETLHLVLPLRGGARA